MNIEAGIQGFSHLWQGLEDVLGPAEVRRLKTPDGSKQDIAVLRSRMDSLYGKTGARGLAICSGRAAFRYLLDGQGQEMGFEEAAFRFLPTRLKVRRGLEFLASWIASAYGSRASVVSGEKDFHFKIEGSLENENHAICDFTAGLLQGFLAWVSGGRFYVVKETECMTLGAECCDYQVAKNPLE
jgi:hypothetical protein